MRRRIGLTGDASSAEPVAWPSARPAVIRTRTVGIKTWTYSREKDLKLSDSLKCKSEPHARFQVGVNLTKPIMPQRSERELATKKHKMHKMLLTEKGQNNFLCF